MNTFEMLFLILYLPIAVFITIRVGWICYTNGEAYLAEIFKNNQHLVNPVNNLLLTGYYLVNIGYAVYILSFSTYIFTINQLVVALSTRLAILFMTLAILHFFNLLSLALFSGYLINKKRKEAVST